MNTILILIILFSILYIVGIGSILYSLICEKDIVRIVRKKPPQFYPQNIDPMDAKITSILDDENFSIDNFSDKKPPEDNHTVILEL